MSDLAKDFLGVWQLADWSVNIAGSDKVRKPFGGNVQGGLIYSPEGWVSATLMERERPAVSQDRRSINATRRQLHEQPELPLNDNMQKQLRQWFLAANGYISYTGYFDVDRTCVNHRVQISLIPQWVGTTLSREYVFSAAGKRLTLTASQGDMTDCLVWDRV